MLTSDSETIYAPKPGVISYKVDGLEEIRSYIPLSEMFGYATDLRSKTQGRGTYVMEIDHFEEVPKSVLDTIVAARAKND